MIDDRFGRDLARQRRLPLYSTTDLAAEMAAAGTIDAQLGWRIFHSVYRGKHREFEAAVESARSRLA